MMSHDESHDVYPILDLYLKLISGLRNAVIVDVMLIVLYHCSST